MSSATDTIRAMLDERGVEYRVSATGYSIDIGPYITAYANRSDTTLDVSLRNFTPEQAIEATLGRGECHKLPSSGDTVCIVRRHGYEMEFGYWKCSACGCECFEGARYCMGCGRKVRA